MTRGTRESLERRDLITGRTGRFHAGVVLTGVEGEVELTSEHLSVVDVNEVIDVLVDHVRLGAERRGLAQRSPEGSLFKSQRPKAKLTPV